MKWMLFVLVFGTHPVETNLLFDNLDACLKAEENMRKEYARAYSQGTWGAGIERRTIPRLSAGLGRERPQPAFHMRSLLRLRREPVSSRRVTGKAERTQ